jgi:hypothetical protein
VLQGFTQRKLPDRSAWITSTIPLGLRPIWEYDAKTLAWDLGVHLAYGAGTGTAFWLLTRNA